MRPTATTTIKIMITKWLLKGLEDLEVGSWRTSGDHPNCWDWSEYWEETWRLEETCCHSNSCERPLANADVIHWEMCKKFNPTNKWFMHNPAPILENVTYKLLRDFDIHTDNLISARRPDLIIINKKKENSQNSRQFLSRLTTE